MKFTAPHYYLMIEVDMDNAIASREKINSLPDTKVSFNDMVVKACAMALRKHPQVNTSWNGDTTRYNQHIHVGARADDGAPLTRSGLPFQMTSIDLQLHNTLTRRKEPFRARSTRTASACTSAGRRSTTSRTSAMRARWWSSTCCSGCCATSMARPRHLCAQHHRRGRQDHRARAEDSGEPIDAITERTDAGLPRRHGRARRPAADDRAARDRAHRRR